MAAAKGKSAAMTVATIADEASCYLALALVAIILVFSLCEKFSEASEEIVVRGRSMGGRRCEEIYVVGEGETLHSISDKCGDPFIVERNPNIHDPDDVFPGLVIMLSPSLSSKNIQLRL